MKFKIIFMGRRNGLLESWSEDVEATSKAKVMLYAKSRARELGVRLVEIRTV